MKFNLRWLRKHPIVAGLVLIGSVGGGVSSLYGGVQYVLSWLGDEESEEEGFEEEEIVLKGRICPVLYGSDCIADNQEFDSQIEGVYGKIIQVELAIDHAWHGTREKLCGEKWADLYYNYANAVPDDWKLMEVPTKEDDCTLSNLIAFDQATLEAGKISSGGGGTEYVISGRFLVGREGTLPPGLPTVAEKGFLTFKPR